MASIQERTGATGTITYRVGYYADGKFKFTPTLADRAGAERIKTIIEKQGPEIALRILGAQQRGQVMTLAEWFAKHVDRKVSLRQITEGTAAGYENEASRTWLPQLGDLPLDTITKDTVEDWVIWQGKQHTARSVSRREKARENGVKTKDLPPLEPVAPKTVRNAHSLLSSVLDTAAEDGLIPRNPAKGVPVPEDGVREEPDIFTREEWAAFYDVMDAHYKPLTAFLLVTGCRIGEATAARVSAVNPKAGTVSVVRAWKKGRGAQVLGTPKSRRSRRVVKVPTWAMKVFTDAAKGKGLDDYLFTARQGGRVHGHRYGERQWAKALDDAGITKHLTPKSARHTFASWALMEGVAPQIVQHRLGHESLQTTSTVYAHLLLDAQNAAVESIGWEPPKQLEA